MVFMKNKIKYLTVADNADKRNPGLTQVPPWGLNPGPSSLEANGWTTGPLELCVEL